MRKLPDMNSGGDFLIGIASRGRQITAIGLCDTLWIASLLNLLNRSA